MAKPVFSFRNSSKNIRYYFILNTFCDLPHSVPMDIVSFLNYMRFNVYNYDEFIRVFHDIFPELVKTGSTLNGIGYEDLMPPIQKQLDFLSTLEYTITGNDELFQQIEDLFLSERNIKRFPDRLQNLLQNAREDLPRPLEFYDSWNHTYDALDWNQNKTYFIEKLSECGFVYADNGNITYFILKKLNNRRNHSAVARFFLKCLTDYKIPLNAIPHNFRSSPEIKKIFALYGAEMLVPGTLVNSNYAFKPEYAWNPIPMKGGCLRRFTEQCLFSNFHIADELRNEINQAGKPLYEFTDEELYNINSFAYSSGKLLNYSNNNGNYLLPFRYLSMTESEDVIFITEIHDNNVVPFGAKRLNKFNSAEINFIQSVNGKIIEVNPSGYFGDEQLWWCDSENSSLNYIRKSNTLLGDTGFISDETCKFSEEKTFYFLSGWFDLKNKPLSPLCFTSAGRFSEGLAPVCLNGKWGFVDTSFNLVIEAQFGHAESFTNGRARVFVLNEAFKKESGNWVELPTWISLSEDDSKARSEKEFARKFPSFPSKHRIPIFVLFNRCWNTVQKNLGYFGNSEGIGLLPSMGRYVYIDRLGNVVDENAYHEVRELIDHDWSRDKLFGKKIENEAFMLKSMLNKKIDYRELPIHYKIKDAFIRDALHASLISPNEIPLQFRVKARPIINQINKHKSIHFITEKLNAVLNERSLIKSKCELLLIHSGKQDDMQFRTLAIKHGKHVSVLIEWIAQNMHTLSKKHGLTHDYNDFANLLCEQLQQSRKFKEPEMDEFSILLNPEGARTLEKKALNKNTGNYFHLFCGDELYQPDSYSAFYFQKSDWDYIKLCEDYLTSYPIEMHETSIDIFKRIVRFLKQKGNKALDHLEIPISESTVGHLLPNKGKQVPRITQIAEPSELDDLPF